ncbi:lamin tail domain-containing protein [Nocardioides sp. Kera G14]|uniref:lamin tail domain-containing protein n=1 Tax=Nocardioides sp. Kera G14 TaxID=2884264 RepID=UPI001D11D6A6|nr:lamin tail domain-containing protein [Nocardioides sp. Kera G14]UDY22806.1 lamin tail domain-containing protein [Nocardioides sp. Kera G14]
MTIRNRSIAALAAGALSLSGLALGFSTPAHADDPSGALGNVVINEVSSNGFTYQGAADTDFVELYNTGTSVVDLTGYKLIDNGAISGATVLDGTIAPGGYAAFVPPAFGLGKNDQGRLFAPDGTTLIDSVLPDGTDWAAHQAPSAARTPDGTGAFTATTNPTPGGPNSLGANATTAAYASIKINEFDTDPTDFIELYNAGSTTVNLSGFAISDGTVPNASTADKLTLGDVDLAPGAYLSISPDTPAANAAGVVDSYLPAGGFGLNKTDALWLYAPDNTVLDIADDGDATNHAGGASATGYGRTTPGFGLWKSEPAPTSGVVNTFAATPPSGTPALDPNWDDVEINEISSLNADDPGNAGLGDAIELYNKGASGVSIDGWYQVDSGAASGAVALTLADLKVWDDTTSSLKPATSMTIPSHGHVVFTSKKGLSGEGDAVKIYGPSATPGTGQLVDEQAYGDGDAGVSDNYDSDSQAFAALPNGSDEFWRVTQSTFGRDNTAAEATKSRRLDTPVVLNEVSNVAGKAELLNTGTATVDISGWELLDNTGTVVHTVPAGTNLAAGAFYVADSVTGLDSADSLSIRRASDQATIVAHTWYDDGIASYSRCDLFGSTSYVETPTATWGAANACPSITTETWPGSSAVTTVDDGATIGDADGNGDGDASGAVFDPTDPNILWVIQNKSTLHKTQKVDGKYVDAPGWEEGKKLVFKDGTGAPDTEGLTFGPDGSLYVTSERDNDNSGVSYNKVLRFDLTGVTGTTTTLTPVDEWDVNSQVTTGANLGLEGITYVPDSFLAGAGWKVGGAAYTAAAYPTDGLFVTAVEATGDLHFFSLVNSAAPVEVKVEKSGLPWSMDVAFDADRKAIWALCDDGCGGVYNLLTVDSQGDLAVAHSLARPAGMPNLNNEGMAIKPRSTAVDNQVEVVWTDDGDTDGYSLREGLLRSSFPEQASEPGDGTTSGGGTTTPPDGGTTTPPDGGTTTPPGGGTTTAPGGGTTTGGDTTPPIGHPGNPAPVAGAHIPSRIKARTKRIRVSFAALGASSTVVNGRVTIFDGKRRIGRFTVKNGVVVIKLKKRLRKGKHHLRLVLRASSTSKAATIRKTLRVR